MHLRQVVFSVAVLALVAPASASAECTHVVAPGESLTSIATLDGLSVSQLASANGLGPTSMIEAGTCLGIPPQEGGSVQSGSAEPVLSAPEASSDEASSDVAAPESAAPGGGAYVVQPGDTLSAIAAREGISVEQLAAANGLDPDGVLLSGSVLQFDVGSGYSSGSASSSQPVGAPAEGSAEDPPYPTPETVTPEQVGSIAAENGVPPSLADAIADQESGFNNDEVSTADARGVMQILPGTWSWIQQALVPGQSPLEPASASDNIRGGVLLLRSLLDSTGDDPALAAAGYYQGLPSVERYGVYPSTQQYVNDVMSLSQQFGGG